MNDKDDCRTSPTTPGLLIIIRRGISKQYLRFKIKGELHNFQAFIPHTRKPAEEEEKSRPEQVTKLTLCLNLVLQV